MKKTLSILLALLLSFSACAALSEVLPEEPDPTEITVQSNAAEEAVPEADALMPGTAEDAETVSGLSENPGQVVANPLTEDFEIFDGTLSRYYGPGGEVVIPNNVKIIGEFAFESCNAVTSIVIPNGVTAVGVGAFRWCNKLTSVTFPDSVKTIGGDAFYGCPRLKTVTLPKKLKAIEGFTFYECTGLTSIDIPAGVQSIGEKAFFGCVKLAGIAIPPSVKTIGDSAFSGCAKLAKVSLSNRLTTIGQRAFEGCAKLTEIAIPSSVKTLGWNAFANCAKLSSVTVYEGLTALRDAFEGDSKLTRITVPTTLFFNADCLTGCSKVTVYVYQGSRAETSVHKGGPISKVVVMPTTSDLYYLEEGNATRKAVVGDKLQIMTPGDKVKKYETSNKKVATVSKKGVVNVKGKGKATITATMIDGIKRKVTIDADKSAKLNKLSIFQGDSVTLPAGCKLMLSPVLAPVNARTTLSWSSDKTGVAKVSKAGLVTAVKAGTAKITVKAKDGKKAVITVKVV